MIWKNREKDIWKRWLIKAIEAAEEAQFVIRTEDAVLYQYHTAGETSIQLVSSDAIEAGENPFQF